MDSWQKYMPEFQIKCWNKDNISECNIPYVQEAISVKKYAFAADYIRLYALYTEGGIYLDSDVELLKPLTSFCGYNFFSGTEATQQGDNIEFNIEAAIMGAVKEHPFVGKCMDYYRNRHFIIAEDYFDTEIAMPGVLSNIAREQYGYDKQNKEYLFGDDFVIFSTKEFINNMCYEKYYSENTVAIHRNAASWKDFNHRGKLFHFCRKHNLMDAYHKFELVMKQITSR